MARKILCVTFDCYGTLIDWEKGITSALIGIPIFEGNLELVAKVVARREELEKTLLVSAPDLPVEESPLERYENLPYRPYREILAESLVRACREHGLELGPEEAAGAAATMPDWEPFADTRRALQQIHEMFPIGILSNAEDEVIEAAVRRIGVPFDLIVTAEKVEAYKPSPDHWYAAMHEMEADEEDLFHIAASPFHDLETATLLGIPCGYVNRTGAPLLPEARPAFTVADLTAVVSKLRSFTSARGKRPSGKAEGRPRNPGGPPREGTSQSRPRR